jgi:cysteine-S-conjugate beta-lyase
MTIDFNKIICRENTCSLKWDYNEEKFGRKDVLPMWVADMDFPSPPQVSEAIIKRAEHGLFGYTRVSEHYNEVVINWMARRNNWRVKEEWFVHSPGVVTSLNCAILAFTEVNDKILIQSPVYYPFFSCVKENSRQLVINPLILKDDYYKIDFEDLDNKLKNNVKMMILCSPHNPGGRVWNREELSLIAKLCCKYNVLLLSDEIHSDLVYKGYKHIPIALLNDEVLQNTITCISPTKTFNVAGLATSLAIIPNNDLKNKFQKTLNRTGADMLNIFGMLASETAYEYGEEWLEALLVYLQDNLNYLSEFISKRIDGIKLIKPEATYLGWLDCRKLPIAEGGLKEFFVKEAGVGLNDGITYGENGQGFQRINFACPRTILIEGLNRIEKAVNKLSK